MTPFRSLLAAVLVVLLSACQQQGPDEVTDTDEEEIPPVPVETALPIRSDIFAVYTGTAPIEAFAEADVIAKVPGEVRELLVEEGDDVVEDQVLARLDGDRLRLELNESQARLAKLRRDYERNKDLQAKGLVSEGEFENIKYEMEALEAANNLASLELDYTQIRAPINGVISERYIKLGNTIKTGDPLFRVTSLDPLVAYLHIPEREYRHIDPGQLVGIEIDALAGERIAANVTRVSPIVDPLTGTFKVTIEITDEGRTIKPGMFGRVGVVYDKHENALQIPRTALVEDAGQTSVFVVEDDAAIRRAIEIGYSDRGMVEVIAGLSDGEQVITVGQVGLKPDALVTIINAEDDDAPEDPTLKVTDNAPTD